MQLTNISFHILSDISVDVTYLPMAIYVFLLLKIIDRISKKHGSEH